MSLSPIKRELLESMFICEKPQKATEVAKDAKKDFQPVMMHLLGLTKMGYVASPEKGLYLITEKGKRVVGIPETTKERATAILSYKPHEKAFHFYTTVDKPLSLHAHNLRDFLTKIEKVEVISLEFHLKRGDFEAWFKGIGDEVLVKKMTLLKKQNLTGETLRTKLREIVGNRYRMLAEFTGQVFPEDQTEQHHHIHEHTHTHDNCEHSHPHDHGHGHEDEHDHKHSNQT